VRLSGVFDPRRKWSEDRTSEAIYAKRTVSKKLKKDIPQRKFYGRSSKPGSSDVLAAAVLSERIRDVQATDLRNGTVAMAFQ